MVCIAEHELKAKSMRVWLSIAFKVPFGADGDEVGRVNDAVRGVDPADARFRLLD